MSLFVNDVWQNVGQGTLGNSSLRVLSKVWNVEIFICSKNIYLSMKYINITKQWGNYAFLILNICLTF